MSDILLSRQELEKLQCACTRNHMELGSAFRPEHLKCLETRFARTSTTLTIKFPSDESAAKWNNYHESQIRYGGHFATAALTTTVALTTGGTAGIVVGTIAAIGKDEVQAKIPYPKVNRGWMIVRKVELTYEQGLHNAYLIFNSTDRVINHKGENRGVFNSGPKRFQVVIGEDFGMGASGGIPEEVARQLINKPNQNLVREYR